ncbi:hypothetical protein Athai_44320 [Actinocatenispora thailandica]|uniref:Peptidase S53 domain-containing protein n=1 Tax=Actinocatenispora thailandica TaxID=227318 RepID=A0A7R7DSB3_9ACTN|nr:carboxypeptidase regulatory-like domain-containing protein [Actinocatenispora thailandica]BCJ36929.1 hypothetical protein Athai_44320 [Actinocatenispora thailandica]
MYGRETVRRRTKAGRYGLALVAAVGLAGLGMQAPAFAAPAVGDTGATAPKVEPVCGTAKKGEFTCFAMRRTDVKGARGIQPNATPSGYGPADLRGAYNLPADGGAGTTVAIVDAYDDPNAEADLAVYRQQYGLPACTSASGCFSKVDQTGGTTYPAPDAGWAGEISLDLDMVSAAAPNANILLVEADSASFEDLGTSVNTAVELGAKYVSNSYGTGYSSDPGSGESPDELTYEQQYYNHPGVAITVSTGDDAYGVAFPAASQYVTAVGGTSLIRDSSPRGWSESVWHNSYGGPGSGCSLYEPKPAFQHDSGCDMRSVADVSAVADPTTGVAVYNSYQASGWAQYGGTSASAPIIAGVYADAGAPVAGSYPNAYPYAKVGALNDVTDGENGSCTPAYWCTAGTGYDGPTGLGTPNGLGAFRAGPHGTVSGSVTNASTGAAISGASVNIGGSTATVGADGSYTMSVQPGDYQVTAAAYGFDPKTVSISVADGGTVTTDLALTPLATHTVSGKVTDGSGHGWPLYAKITVDGVPGGPVYSDPFTGKYSLSLPTGSDYTLHATPQLPGYTVLDSTVKVADKDIRRNLKPVVDQKACAAPGYAITKTGVSETFDTTTTPAGWTTTDATGNGGWAFDNPGHQTNYTGGTGNFAIADGTTGTGARDTSMVSPSVDLSNKDHPTVTFDTYRVGGSSQVADIDVSTDGGSTWTNAWRKTGYAGGHQEVDLPGAANHADVRVRFRYTGNTAYSYWQVDDVFFGDISCLPVHGGLVAGRVTDANTGDGLDSVSVVSKDKPAETATTADAAGVPGYYWMFSSLTGSHTFTGTKASYHTESATVAVAPDALTPPTSR